MFPAIPGNQPGQAEELLKSEIRNCWGIDHWKIFQAFSLLSSYVYSIFLLNSCGWKGMPQQVQLPWEFVLAAKIFVYWNLEVMFINLKLRKLNQGSIVLLKLGVDKES